MWVLLQDISNLLRLSWTVQLTYFIIYEICFTCFKVECKRSYIFRSSSNETIIKNLDMDCSSGVCSLYSINCAFRSLKGKASIGNLVNKLYSLTKFNRPFRTSKKTGIRWKHETRWLLKSHYRYWNVFYFICTCIFSRKIEFASKRTLY